MNADQSHKFVKRVDSDVRFEVVSESQDRMVLKGRLSQFPAKVVGRRGFLLDLEVDGDFERQQFSVVRARYGR